MTMPSDNSEHFPDSTDRNNEVQHSSPEVEAARFRSAGGGPACLSDVFELYYDRYKPLYNQIQTYNQMPVELVFELAAAWDHLSRHWKYGENEQSCCDKAGRHIKRAILDAFKLLLKSTVDEYNELRRIDTSLIDNGEYDRALRLLMAEIRQEAVSVRTREGDSEARGSWHQAFEVWDDIHQKCEKFRREFYLSPHVDWAKQKTEEFSRRRRWDTFWTGAVASFCVTSLFWLVAWLLS